MEDKSLFNSKDSMDISELASLNDEISPELIEQLQQKLSQDALQLNENTKQIETKQEFDINDDTTLFEETYNANKENENNINAPKSDDLTSTQNNDEKPKKKVDFTKNFDDNFLKKYKAKLNKQKDQENKKSVPENSISSAAFPETIDSEKEDIENLSQGNITEKKMSKAQKEYNDSLDFLDGNVKYSKYVIYIDPQNVDFINSLTVKERKNLINKILREQDDIAITKQRFKIINTVVKHIIVVILTITIAIPIIYWTMNASLEATINNYRHSQTIFQTLYKKNGKITQDMNK